MHSHSLIKVVGLLSLLAKVDAFPSSPRSKLLAMLDVTNPADLSNVQSDEGDDSFQLLGDLVSLPAADLTQVGGDIRELLLNYGAPESDLQYADVPALDSAECKQDTCCVWKYIADDMTKLFREESGQCTQWARKAIRLGFHDAGTWSVQTAKDGGGADGSICLTDENTASENAGLEEMCAQMNVWYDKWNNQHGFAITMADLIQMGANIATVICPLGPRVRSFVGRKDAAVVNNVTLLPNVFSDAVDLTKLFRAKTISPHQLVALVGAHTASQQQGVNVTRAGDPQDSTPGVWDTLFYEETYGTVNAPESVFKFPSDIALAKYAVTAREWVTFFGTSGQDHWNKDYARAYIRLSLLGVNNINDLTECTKALPARTIKFSNSNSTTISLTPEQITEQVELGGFVDASSFNPTDTTRDVELRK
ncbi:peroxidase [Xylariaceae sp. FL1272]|nr:peroxidase [Xylariaceae sp. FL1272]